ncbi:MAG: acyltransferase [Cryomorphaceae bacterium]
MTLFDRIIRRLNTIYWSVRGAKIGRDSVISRRVEIWNPKSLTMGNGSLLGKSVSVYSAKEGFLTLGNESHIAAYGYLLIDQNKCSIGDKVAIGPFCSFICHSNSVKGESEFFTENYLDGDIEVGNNVFIGAQCTILPGTKISDNVVIASNSVVRGFLKSGFIYGGTPAKQIKPIKE